MSNFSVAAIFSNHCVLQRNKNISIFGTADSGTLISVELYNSKNELLTSNKSRTTENRWLVQLLPQVEQTDCVLKIKSDSKEVVFSDVSIGEVWIAGGQSNMEFELQNCTEGPEELKSKNNPKIRFYYTNKIGWKDDAFYEAERNTSWQTWDSEWKKAWSAVGYFFGKKLSEDLNVTVGIIGCNWGGTSASAWMNKESLEKDDDLRTYLIEQEEATKGKTIQQQCEEYDKYVIENDEWQKKCNELYATVPGIEWEEIQERIGPCAWPGPKSCKNPYRPTGLYECMLQRIMPYTNKGVIWYQGESDDHKPQMYQKLFSRMIQLWREDWNDSDMPFIFVQLPEHRYKQDRDFKHWCFIREAQLQTSQYVKNAFMTCALDLGQYNDIHPKAKKTLGERMARTALGNVYNLLPIKDVSGPIFEEAISKDGKLILTFKNADDGFQVKSDEEEFNYYKEMEKNQNNSVPDDFTGFEIAGNDGIYYPATFAFSGTEGKQNIITLFNKNVPEPVFGRYAWYNYGPVTIFGKNGIPLSPFRTSCKDTKTTTEHAKIQQIMTV